MNTFTSGYAVLGERETRTRRPSCLAEKTQREGVVTGNRGQGESLQTLDDVMVSVWAALRAGAPIACPVCESLMEPRWSAGAGVVGGRCQGCGSEFD